MHISVKGSVILNSSGYYKQRTSSSNAYNYSIIVSVYALDSLKLAVRKLCTVLIKFSPT